MKIQRNLSTFLLTLLLPVYLFGFWRNIPEEISYASPSYWVSDNQVEFLRDLTYQGEEKRIVDQEIYPSAYSLIDSAEKFLVLDIFLFIETSLDTNSAYIPTTTLLTNKLLEKKKNCPTMPIYFITDEFNIFYYSHRNTHLEQLKEAGIEVIVTDMICMPDSHQPYSLIWRLIPRWFGNPNYRGWLPNPFTEPEEKIALRSVFKLLNFKANHRKIIMSEKAAIITSANPHTSSSLHSNIGFYIEGEVLQDILASEKAVAEISDKKIDIEFTPQPTQGDIEIKYITEGKIRESLLTSLEKLTKGDSLDISVFYFSDRKIIKSIKKAHKRGVNIRLHLDANKDAFGKQKNGIPNRQVAWELYKKGIPIKWANTHGEQFHTKMAIFTFADSVTIIGGSANFTKRNIGDKNLESDLLLTCHKSKKIAIEVKKYYQTIWNDERYSLPFSQYKETSKFKYLIYRIQEFTGACTY